MAYVDMISLMINDNNGALALSQVNILKTHI
jgi:hypothetical protein